MRALAGKRETSWNFFSQAEPRPFHPKEARDTTPMPVARDSFVEKREKGHLGEPNTSTDQQWRPCQPAEGEC